MGGWILVVLTYCYEPGCIPVSNEIPFDTFAECSVAAAKIVKLEPGLKITKSAYCESVKSKVL